MKENRGLRHPPKIALLFIIILFIVGVSLSIFAKESLALTIDEAVAKCNLDQGCITVSSIFGNEKKLECIRECVDKLTKEPPTCWTCHGEGKLCDTCRALWQEEYDQWKNKTTDNPKCHVGRVSGTEWWCHYPPLVEQKCGLACTKKQLEEIYNEQGCKLCLDTCRKNGTDQQQYKCSVNTCKPQFQTLQCVLPKPGPLLALNKFTDFASIPGGFGCNPDPKDPKKCAGGAVDVSAFIRDVLSIGSFVFGGLAVLKIIFGGVMYATAAGNAQRIADAKSHILYALLGLALVLGANIMLGLFGAGTLY